ncbi:Hypothetical predicted protein [Paramuricea clavata]|uniref:Uncharacterized protein n=1 Tax=Paramuricea clavata TaxID=317549 RepID=A0A6S7K0M4_PARCT|nr:Hypothetical predicted protein [Paramuricea clavata]
MLDRNHRVTRLIIEECHERVHHNGVKETLTEIRSKFWIVKGRQLIRKIIPSCVPCRRFEGKPYNPADPPPLPKSRIVEDPPFTCTGIDVAGPLYVKNEDKSSLEMAKTESHRLRIKNTPQRRIVRVGDVVVIRDDTPRVSWKIGRVEERITGKDDQVRGAAVKISSKGMKPSKLRRPIQALIPLEINDAENEDAERENPSKKKDDPEETVETLKPRRKAAVTADELRKQWLQQLS